MRDVLAEKSRRALKEYLSLTPAQPTLAVAGGVAANMAVRGELETVCAQHDTAFLAPPLALCTDNAAMIAWAGIERFRAGQQDDMTLQARPRWPLDQRAPRNVGIRKEGGKGMSISVLGAGAFGTALAISLAQSGRAVGLWARDPGDMASARENTRRLPGFAFPDGLTVLEQIEDVQTSDIILLAVPMQKLAGFLAENATLFQGKTLVACCKGCRSAVRAWSGRDHSADLPFRHASDPVWPQLCRGYRSRIAHRTDLSLRRR